MVDPFRHYDSWLTTNRMAEDSGTAHEAYEEGEQSAQDFQDWVSDELVVDDLPTALADDLRRHWTVTPAYARTFDAWLEGLAPDPDDPPDEWD